MVVRLVMGRGEEQGWRNLSQLDPKDVCRRSLATFDSDSLKYTLRILKVDYNVALKEKIIRRVEQKEFLPEFKDDFRIMVLDYLVNSKDIPLSGKLVAGVQLKTGEFFFRGTHGLELDPLIKAFGNDPERFKSIGILLGGRLVDLGDVSIQLQVLPRVAITYILWAADEEFPARISVLFDSTADSHMHLDTLRTAVTSANKSLLAIRPG